jgi:hypothetical protein
VEVEGLDPQLVTSGHIRSLFHQCGVEVISVEFPKPRAVVGTVAVIVEFQSVDAALEAVSVMNGGWVNGKQVLARSIAQAATAAAVVVAANPTAARTEFTHDKVTVGIHDNAMEVVEQ